jgi:hypothetical protein
VRGQPARWGCTAEWAIGLPTVLQTTHVCTGDQLSSDYVIAGQNHSLPWVVLAAVSKSLQWKEVYLLHFVTQL